MKNILIALLFLFAAAVPLKAQDAAVASKDELLESFVKGDMMLDIYSTLIIERLEDEAEKADFEKFNEEVKDMLTDIFVGSWSMLDIIDDGRFEEDGCELVLSINILSLKEAVEKRKAMNNKLDEHNETPLFPKAQSIESGYYRYIAHMLDLCGTMDKKLDAAFDKLIEAKGCRR